VFARAIDEHFTEFTDKPDAELDETGLVPIAVHSVVDLGDGILMELGGG